jgi:hypothetical protein
MRDLRGRFFSLGRFLRLMAEPMVKWIRLAHMPLAPIYTRLGYREGFSEPAIRVEYEPLLRHWVADTRIQVFYAFEPFALEPTGCRLGNHAFVSRLIADRFAQAQNALVMAASADPPDYAKIRQFADSGDLKQSVILDAVLSEKVDFALDFLETELTVEIRREGRRLGPRLSCGYGDFDLSNQQYFFETLRLGRYGITLDERCVLNPEKTVTAVAPVF